ncbi:MAG: hypothetical protein R2940_13270 [Syntrophotaleaceae bacterium]
MEKMTTVFLDTEFTHLDAPKLISIGLVSICGREFYAELTDGWGLQDCSLFVLGQVLPLLDNEDAKTVLRSCLGDLFDVLRWLTAENLDERRMLLASPAVQRAMLHEHRWALEHTGMIDLPAAAIPRLAESLSRLELAELIKGKVGRTRRQAAKELATWFAEFHGPVRIIADSPLDHQVAQRLLRSLGGFPPDLYFGLLSDLGLTINHEVREAFFIGGGRRHHALDDARALHRSSL